MGKLTTFMLVMSGVILLCYFFGLLENTATSTLIDMLLDPVGGFKNSNFFSKLLLAVETVILVGATIFSLSQKSDFPIMAVLVIPLINIGWDFMSIYTLLAAENFVVATLIFSPLLIVYVLTVIEWWRGVDT